LSWLYVNAQKHLGNTKKGEDLALVGFDNGNISLYKIQNDDIIWIETYKEHKKYVWGLIMLSNYKESYFASGSFDRSIKIWQIGNLKSIKTLNADYYIVCIKKAINYDNNLIISNDYSGLIQIWNIETGRSQALENENHEYVRRLLHLKHVYPFNLLLACSAKSISLWDIQTFALVRTYNAGAQFLKYWKNNIFISYKENEYFIRLWNIENINCLSIVNNFPGKICGLGLYRKESIMLLNNEKGINCIDLVSGKSFHMIEGTGGDLFLIKKINNPNSNSLFVASGYDKNYVILCTI
jgi:WD40 repeat protein